MHDLQNERLVNDATYMSNELEGPRSGPLTDSMTTTSTTTSPGWENLAAEKRSPLTARTSSNDMNATFFLNERPTIYAFQKGRIQEEINQNRCERLVQNEGFFNMRKKGLFKQQSHKVCTIQLLVCLIPRAF